MNTPDIEPRTTAPNAYRLTRREFALTAAAVSVVPAVSLADEKAMKSSNGDVSLQDLDPVRWTLERYQSAPLRLTFRATNKADAEAWQRELRAKLTELIGGFPERTPLNPRTLDIREYPGYRREHFVFYSRPGVAVVGYLLVPTKGKAPFATVVAIPGHGRGVEDIVGIDEQGHDRTDKPGYEHDFAIQVVEHGMAAVAIEPMAFGYRRDERTRAEGDKASACQPAAGSALLLGETMIGWRVWDVMRTIDWINTRPELDASRVGCMGISGGGTCTLFASALDLRIKAAFVSGYLNTFRASIMSMSHCIDNYVPGILNYAENYDVAGLIAPRPLFSEGGNRDPIFPVSATRESYQRVKKVYEVFDAGENVQQEIFDGEHVFHGAKGLPFLAGALKA
ncbi:MAG TPA: alpha/beta hydrolase family protein [Bryobacteraceae bacterium]|jgi:dienelactone hydrolase|nr:alpha/beta hydrolase family protein [Bryobacteraceae bacterium]